jgi:AcrR family transcriptional regulator
MTRQESHAQTRDRLVATAHRLFLADGFNATSLERVAAEAGYSKGAVYSNFATKPELGLAVLDVIHAERAMSLAAAVAVASSVDERMAGFARWAEENIGDVGWTALEVEFATSTRHLPGMRAELATRRRTLTAMVAALIEDQADQLGLELPMPAEDAAVQLLSLGIGLGVQRAFDPELPVRTLVDLLGRLIESATPQ